ncbi:MAG: SDR family NAD(P)-dependent oxidoreductase [Bacteroidetes bacterium]|nr:SDR family NAD(P)-dependent oxidoreductase [Fibrella sp.]
MNTEHRRVALVTGANKGIGYEVVRQLARQDFAVFLGARDHQLGHDAAEALCAEGYDVTFLLLDVCDPVSITNATGVVSQKADHLDVLINNAAILEHEGVSIISLNVESLNRTMQTNVNGPILMTQFFLSFLEKAPHGARVINVSSSAGSLTTMQTYAPAYSISKTALNAVTRQFSACLKDKNIAVNSVDPGWVRTDMGGANAERSVEQGADTIVWLATEAPVTATGNFWRDRKETAW